MATEGAMGWCMGSIGTMHDFQLRVVHEGKDDEYTILWCRLCGDTYQLEEDTMFLRQLEVFRNTPAGQASSQTP